jgi:hypothetical protein
MYRILRLAIADVLLAATVEAQTVERFRAACPAIAPGSDAFVQ